MQHAPVDVPATTAPVVIVTQPGGRRFLLVLGSLLAFVLPTLALLFDPTGTEVHCKDGVCVVVDVRAFLLREERVRFPIADVTAVSLTAETQTTNDRGRHRRFRTGRSTLVASVRSLGHPVDLSLPKPADALRMEEARAVLVDHTSPDFSLQTRATVGDLWGVVVCFLLGLFFLVVRSWTVVVGGDANLGLATVQRRWPPLPAGPVHAFRRGDVADIITPEQRGLFAVIVRGTDGGNIRVCRTLSRFRAEEVRDAIWERVRP